MSEDEYKVKVEYPLKQGLKLTIKNFALVAISHVKVEYPLKQGLKHFYRFAVEHKKKVKVEYPLKQGLKLCLVMPFNRYSIPRS